MRTYMLFLTIAACIADQVNQETSMGIAERLAKTLPQIPSVIHSQMEGKPEELRAMISQMLGDGLISQLVVNPLGVAEGMGVPLSTLGINKTDVENRFRGANSNGTLSGGLIAFATTPTTTTEKVMYLDGVPIKDFDQFVRNRNLEERFSTKKPATTTTPIPSASDIAAAVVDQLKVSMPVAQPTSSLVQKQISETIYPQNSDMILADPSRIREVSTLLRRAPQKFDMPGTLLGNAPTTFAQNSLDPEVNAVVTSLRTGNVMNVEQIRQLQNILQNYEQSLQTKELIAKRKQLQLLQNELIEQRKKIEEQRKLEEELRKKEQELEHERQAMELQLQEQLRMWHSSFSNPNAPKIPLMPVELSEPALPIVPHSIAPSPLPVAVATTIPDKRLPMFLPSAPSSARADPDIPSAKSLPNRPELTQEKREDIVPPVTVNQFWPKVVEKAYRNHKIATTTDSRSSQSQSGEDSDEFTSSCQCEKISLQKMKGKWSMALASKALIEKLRAKLKKMLPKEPRTELSCSRMTMLTPKISEVAQDARISWEFRTSGSRKLYRFIGSALSMDHRSVRLQLRDSSNEIFSVPMCVLKYSGLVEYDYMVVTNGNGPCREAALLVRNVDRFFDEDNSELVSFLKRKIANDEMDSMDIAPFANECSQN
uniref:Uncharacterized protein n=1 Tax=Haemonchus contortus TaxID=6289 RepID=A0A7I4YZ94_HAECO